MSDMVGWARVNREDCFSLDHGRYHRRGFIGDMDERLRKYG